MNPYCRRTCVSSPASPSLPTYAVTTPRIFGGNRVHPGRRALWISADDMKQEDALGVPLNDDAVAVLEEQQGVHAVWVFPYNGKPVHLTSTKAWHRPHHRRYRALYLA